MHGRKKSTQPLTQIEIDEILNHIVHGIIVNGY
eukprot:gene22641-29315_t